MRSTPATAVALASSVIEVVVIAAQ